MDWAIEASGVNDMQGSYFCPAWLVQQAPEPSDANLAYQTHESAFLHPLPVTTDGKTSMQEKEIKLSVPILAACTDKGAASQVVQANGQDVMKLTRGMLPLSLNL